MSGNDARGDELRAALVDGQEPSTGPVHLAEPDPAWPGLFEHEAERLRAILGAGGAARSSTSGRRRCRVWLRSRYIDMVLVVADSSDEAGYVPPLEAAGYVLRIREPDWHEHRLLKGPNADVTCTCSPRGGLRSTGCCCSATGSGRHPEDRERYEAAKRELAARDWPYVQDYADAKSEVVEEIIARASAARSAADD